MNHTWKNRRVATIMLLGASVVVFFMSACKRHPKIYNFPNYVNWNVVTPPEATEDDKKKGLDSVLSFIRNLKYPDSASDKRGRRRYPIYSKTDSIKVYTCPCDPNLTNITANLIVIDSSGDATLKPPPPPRTPTIIKTPTTPNQPTSGSEGDRTVLTKAIQPGARFTGFPGKANNNVILAVMDTGLDTTLFDPQIGGLIWQEPVPGNTLYNFLPGEDSKILLDDNASHHGSAATAIALKEVTAESPRIMVLKVLDAHGHGSVFSVSCGLAYARKNNASVINASLGYYGEKDSVFTRYFTKIYDSTIIVTAAGNDTTKPHHSNRLCKQPVKPSNELRAGHLFFPACFSDSTEDLISVTGLAGSNETIWSCYYQNYSDVYVTLGVLKTGSECCTMTIPFPPNSVEGSSFVAPVVSGKLSNYIIQNGFKPTTKLYLQGIGVTNAAPMVTNEKTPSPVKYTVRGQYIKN